MPRYIDIEKVKIVLESFIKNNGHYRKMSEELTAMYGPGYSIGTISNIMNGSCINSIINEREKEQIEKILLMNHNKLIDEEQLSNLFYKTTKEEQQNIITKLYLNGRTMEQIANALGISKAKVSRVIKQASESSNDVSLEELERIKAEHKQNNSGSFRK